MNYKSHVFLGVVFAICLIVLNLKFGFFVFKWWLLPVYFVVAVFCAILPDIDIHSKAQKITVTVLLLFSIYLTLSGNNLLAVFLLVLTLVILNLLKHRGVTHSVFMGVFVFGITFFALDFGSALFAITGFIAHLVGDSL